MSLDNFLASKNKDRILPQFSKEEVWASENYYQPEIVLNRIQPDIAIYCNVNTFRAVSRSARDIVQILDFYGPVQLEGLLLTTADHQAAMQDAALLEGACRDMVQKLRQVDYIVTVSERQKYFWSAYCTLAGFSFSDVNVLVCPAAFETPPVTRNPTPHLSVIYSGGFYPWQNPERFLRAAAAMLEEIEGATLHIFGGPHTGMPNEAQANLMLRELQEYRCVKYHGYRPIEEVMETLSTAWCALELMEQNLERELAVTGRTLEFLASGTPVIYNNYATLSKLIERYQAGWTLSTTETSGLRPVFEELARGGLELVRKLSCNARRLAAEEFSSAQRMRPLLDLCAGPVTKRDGATAGGGRRAASAKSKSLGRVLAISPGRGSLVELRVSNPLRALQRQGYIDGMSIAGTSLNELKNDTSQYDAILVQRAVPEFVIETLQNMSLPFALECDDNILARAAYRDLGAELSMVAGLRHCSILIAPNPRLVHGLEKYSGVRLTEKAFITPNALPFPQITPAKPASQPSQILWIQSDIAALANSRDAVVRAVDDFSRRYTLPVILIGPNVLRRPEFQHQVVMGEIDFTSNLQLLEFAPTSLGVAPLETDADQETLDFVAGKSDLKILLFAGYGHAGVYSNAPPYTDSALQDGLSITGNTYEEWAEALEYQYREGWRKLSELTPAIQAQRHIDRVAAESWRPAIRACQLSNPVRGVDIYKAFRAASEIHGSAVQSAAYLAGNWDVARGYVAYDERTAWDHYRKYGHREERRARHAPEAHRELLSRINEQATEYFATLKDKLQKNRSLLDSLHREAGTLKAQRKDLTEQIEKQQQELARLAHELSLANAVVGGVINSRSWKVTAPLRKVAGLFRNS
jgi:glycosyltransferase involved in cell wall biosynthesis